MAGMDAKFSSLLQVWDLEEHDFLNPSAAGDAFPTEDSRVQPMASLPLVPSIFREAKKTQKGAVHLMCLMQTGALNVGLLLF